MNFNSLASETMLANSNAWLTDKKVSQATRNSPLAREILRELGISHANLATEISQRKLLDAAITRITELLATLDTEHDTKARALYMLLEVLRMLARTAEEAEALASAQSVLFPDNLLVTKRSYSEEHGAALEMETRITPEIRTLLSGIPIADFTLIDLYDAWIAAGRRMGEPLAERARLKGAIARTSDRAPVIDTKSARSGWISAAQLFLGVLDRLPLEASERNDILAQLENDIAAAEARRLRGGASSDDSQDQGTDDQTLRKEGTPERPDNHAARAPGNGTASAGNNAPASARPAARLP